MDPESNEERRGFSEEIDSAEVVVVILTALNQCLVLDSRRTAEDPPEMSVSPPLGSGERRLQALNQARPHLPNAQRMLAIPWAGSVNALVRSGVWNQLVDRMLESGFEGIEKTCQSCLDQLRKWEHIALVTMIQGHGPYRTLWPRASKRE